MTNKIKKNIAAIVALSVMYLIFLLNNFSAAGCVIAVFSVLYLLLSACFSKRAAKAEYGIVDNLGDYFGVSIFYFLTVSVFSIVEKTTGSALADLIKVVKGPKFSSVMTLAFVGIIVAIIIVIMVLKKIHRSSVRRYESGILQPRGKLSAYISKYVVLGIASYFLFNAFIAWDVFVCIGILLTYLLLNVLVEKVYENNSNFKKMDTVFYWCIANTVVFALLQYMWPKYSITFVDGLINTAFISWHWYSPFVITLLLFGVGVYAYQLDSNERAISIDAKLCLAVVVNLISIPISVALYDKYIAIVYIALAIINVMFFRNTPSSTRYKENSKLFIKQLVVFLISVVVTFYLWFSFISGTFAVTILIAISIPIGVVLYKNSKSLDGIWFWSFVIIASAIISATTVYTSYNATKSYGYIIISAAISVFAIIILNVKNKKHFTGNRILKTVVVLCAFLLIIVPVRNFGIDYDVSVANTVSRADNRLGVQGLDTNMIYITVTPRGKGNSIETCEYYWGDAQKHETARIDRNGVIELNPRNDTLYIYSVDSNGVASTLTRRFYFRHLDQYITSGQVKNIEGLFKN